MARIKEDVEKNLIIRLAHLKTGTLTAAHAARLIITVDLLRITAPVSNA